MEKLNKKMDKIFSIEAVEDVNGDWISEVFRIENRINAAPFNRRWLLW